MLTPDAQYAANLAVLAQQPALQPLIAQMAAMPLTNLQLFPSPTGALLGCVWDVVTQTWIPVCDAQDPVGAAEAAADQMWSPNHTVYTMMGLGLGYAVAALTKRLLPYQRLVVWDGDGGLFKAMLYALDVQEMFTGKRVEIFVGPNLLQQMEPWHMRLEVHEKLHMALPISHGYTSVYRKDEYAALLAKTMDMIRFHMVGLATWRQFGRCIGDNDLENMPEYFLHPGLTALKDLWKDKPAVCVAAGPSLQRTLKLLLPAQQRRKVALLTVGTTYGLLQGMGLQPDIVTFIDFQKLCWTDQGQHIPFDPDCSLVYLHSTYPQTVRRWPGPRFVAENSSDTLNWIKQWAEDEKGQAGMVQTVAHLNLITALMLGANPIIMLGQDLSMPATMHHAVGSRAQDTAPHEVPQEAMLLVNDMYGCPVATRHSFQSMLLVFERIIADHPATTFINASEQGVLIPGAAHRSFASVLASLPDMPLSDAPRPLFQGETITALGHRQASPLQAALHHASTTYVPRVKEGMVEGVATAMRQIEEIAAWAQTTQRQWAAIQARTLGHDERQAAESSDCLTDAETRAQLCLPAYQALAATEQVLTERPAAVGMLVIRRFDFLELRGEIPPPAAMLAEPWQQARYAADRLVRVAQMFAEEAPTVLQLLRRTLKRLTPSSGLLRAIAQQHYAPALAKIKTMQASDFPWPSPSETALHALLYRHTQQYAAALALGLSERQAHRVRTHLARYHADVRHALSAYLETPAAPALPLDDQDVTHAWAVPVKTQMPLPLPDIVLPDAPQKPVLNGHSRPVYRVDAAGYLQPQHEERT